MSKFIDKRGSDHSMLLNWEVFVDRSYFDCICVRMVSDRDFNSNTTFHFITDEQANSFVELLMMAH